MPPKTLEGARKIAVTMGQVHTWASTLLAATVVIKGLVSFTSIAVFIMTVLLAVYVFYSLGAKALRAWIYYQRVKAGRHARKARERRDA